MLKLGVPELPWMGPFALATPASVVVPFVLGPNIAAWLARAAGAGAHAEAELASALVVAGAALFHVVAAVGLSLGYARLDARVRGVPGGLGAGLLKTALSRAPRLLALLVLFSLACGACLAFSGGLVVVVTNHVSAWPKDSVDGPLLPVLVPPLLLTAWAALVVVSARLMIAAPLVAVDGSGVFAALREAWRSTKGHAWSVTWRTALGIFVSFVFVEAGAVASFVLVRQEMASFAAAFVVACGVILPLDAVFIYVIYRRLRAAASS